MAYPTTVVLSIGSRAWATKRATLVDASGPVTGHKDIATGFQAFTDVDGKTVLVWRYASVPDGFDGGIVFHDGNIGVAVDFEAVPIMGIGSAAPRETENSDVKTSTRGDATAANQSVINANVLAVPGQITTDHGAGSYVRNTEPDNAGIAAAAHVGDAMTLTVGERTAINSVLSTSHGEGSWEGEGGGAGDGSVEVTEDHGGDGNLMPTSGGLPVDNVTVRAYLKTDYDAGNRALAYVKGETTTDVNGAFAPPLMLDPATYTFVYFKQGEFGPNTKEQAVS